MTDLLKDAGLVDATWYSPASRELGRAVHAATAYLDEGDLRWDGLDPLILPRLRSYQKFLEEVKPEILAVEEEVEHNIYRYIGHLDRRLKIDGREGILDLKPPSPAPYHPLQLAFYCMTFPRPMARWNLYLHDDRYALVEHKDRKDYEVAKAAITLVNWRKTNAV